MPTKTATKKSEPKPKKAANGTDAAIEANGKAPTSTWKGTVMLGGVISIPVRMYTAARGERISFNQLHGGENGCGGRLNQGPMHCRTCDVDVPADQIVKGYDVGGSFVQLTKEEINAQKPQSSSTMEIEQFVKLADVNPMYFEASYYLDSDSELGAPTKSYAALRQGMIDKKVAAIGKVAIRQNENVVFILPHPDGGLVAYTAYLASEIRPMRFRRLPEISDKERVAVGDFIEKQTEELDMSQYTDSYQDNLAQLIEDKQAGRKPKIVEIQPAPPQKDNLLEMLSAMNAVAQKRKKRA
jgi:DNA end-binding protein Ku